MLDHLEPYLLAPSSLTPTALLERAAALLTTLPEDVTAPVADTGTPTAPEAIRLRHCFLYDAWLVRWSPGDATDLHAHGTGFRAVAVVTGALVETVATPDGLDERVLPTGTQVTSRPGHTHRLVAGEEGAVSLVLSSPPLASPPLAATPRPASPPTPTSALA